MDILAGIGAATEGLKLVNELRKIDKEMDKADLKLRLVEVADKLLDSKQALQDVQEREFALQKAVVELKDKLADRGRYRDRDGLLFEVDTNDQEIGQPFCNHCYVKEAKLYRLLSARTNQAFRYSCQNCDGFYERNPDYRPINSTKTVLF